MVLCRTDSNYELRVRERNVTVNTVDVENVMVFCSKRAPQQAKAIGNLSDFIGEDGMLKGEGE